jgi:hypothetical protein
MTGRPPGVILEGVTTKSTQSPLQELVFAGMAARVVYAAAELGLPDRLAAGPLAPHELAPETHAPSLRRLLRALAGLGVVAQSEGERFELTELGRTLRPGDPASIHALVRMLCCPDASQSWDELVPSIETGGTGWERAHGATWIEHYERDPAQGAIFNRAMAEHTRDAAPGIIFGADLGRFRTILDLGGGDGALMAEILGAHERAQGVLCDLPSALADAPGTLAAAGVADRCRVIPADFFVEVPDGADAYVLKQIVHDWNDERATAILRNCRAAMAPDSRLLLVERVLPERLRPEDAPALLVDVLMLVTTGGRERTEPEFRRLLDDAGFALARLSDPLPFGYRVIEAAPKA